MTVKVIHAVTASRSLGLMKGQLKYLKDKGYNVKALCSDGDNIEAFEQSEGVPVLRLGMEREISFLKDARSLAACVQLLRKEKPDIVSAGTPKAGLIVTLAGLICGVPVRVYTVRGLRLETTSGSKRKVLLAAERMAAGASTHCVAVSHSLRRRVIDCGITSEDKIRVLGNGSSNGLVLERFTVTAERQEMKERLKREYGLTDDHIVMGFVGRLTKDKGIDKTIGVFQELRATYPNLRLLIVGKFESGDAVSDSVRRIIEEDPHIIHTDYQPDPIPFFWLMDLFVFLTKREGFCNVTTEAAMCGIPVIAADVTGTGDTMLDGETGYLVDAADRDAVCAAAEKLIVSKELRTAMGQRGKEWVTENFSSHKVWGEIDNFYKLLHKPQEAVAPALKPQ